MAERDQNDNPDDDFTRKQREKGKAKVDEDDHIAFNLDLNFNPAADHQSSSTAHDDLVVLLDDDSPSKRRRIEAATHEILNHTNNPARPGSRVMSIDNLRISRILYAYDVVQVNPRLIIDELEASILADDPDLDGDEPPPLSYRKAVLAFDEFDRQFNLLLIVDIVDSNGSRHFMLTGGWGVFANMHRLRAGDEIMFYKYKDARVSNDYYYALRYFRKPKPVRVVQKKIGDGDDKQGKDKQGKDKQSKDKSSGSKNIVIID